ncbi:MAG TPA: biotin transporter BioY [Candidatus Wallbacteria bacterium]|nr:biotin transporter BioY [Candidatus Wallbacteria bacterium]
MKKNTNKLVLTALFAALTAVGAFIRIPMPFVPVTMQTMFVSFAGIFLGPYYGALSQLVYIMVGLSGIPIFANGGGPSYIFQPSFGFLIGFVFASYAMGKIFELLKEAAFKNLLIVSIAGQIVIYAFGLPYLYFINKLYLNSPMPLDKLLYFGSSLFIVSGGLTVIVVSYVSSLVYPRLQKFNLR